MFKDNNKNTTTTSSQEKKKIFLRKACFLKIRCSGAFSSVSIVDLSADKYMSADKSNIPHLSKNLPVFGS